MVSQERKPYVVSADTQGLLKSWACKNRITLPNDKYFQSMLGDLELTLRQYFSEVDVVPEDFLRKGLNGLVRKSDFPVVSLDRAYVNVKQANLIGFIDATRTVDNRLNNAGLGSRRLEITIDQQIGQLSARLKGKVINLVDDVIFEGNTILGLVEKFRRGGVTVDTVFSGITIREGQQLLEQNSINVDSLLVYDQVVDEICQRDFVVGCPYSGRSVVNGTGVIEGVPYLYPFGKPVEWASIPEEKAVEFSLFVLAQALNLWTKTEQLTRQNIPPQLLSKPVFGLPQNSSITQSLRDAILGLERNKDL